MKKILIPFQFMFALWVIFLFFLISPFVLIELLTGETIKCRPLEWTLNVTDRIGKIILV